MEVRPVGKTTERFYGNVDVPQGGYTGLEGEKARLVYDHANENVDVHGTIRLEPNSVVWDDIQVGISNIRVPTSQAPTERLYDHGIGGGVTFPVLGFDVGQYIYYDVQTSHRMKLSTILDNHLHFTLPDTTDIGDLFQFQLDVIAAGINAVWAAPAGTPFTAEHTVVADDNISHRLISVADIPAVNTTVSSVYKMKLTRIAASVPANEYGSEVYVHFADSHYELDTMGSREEASK